MPRLRKLYVDCVDDTGSVAVAYVTVLDGGGLSLAPAGVELYDPCGARTVHRGRAYPALDEALRAEGPLALRFDLPAGPCRLELAPDQGAFASKARGPLGLHWHVAAARARVELHGLRGPGDVLTGTGYADCVTLTRTPRALRLERLEWGRAHLAHGSIVYTRLEHAGGLVFASAVLWPRAAPPLPLDRFALEPGARPGERRLRFDTPEGRCELELLPSRELHHGAAVERGRFPSVLERALSRAVAGPTRERRWLSRAECSPFGAGSAVHESVHFGARAAEPVA
jgi:hypothetical protein